MDKKEIFPAIVVVGYNRPKCLERLLHSLRMASYPSNNINLIISLDKSSIQNEVYEVANKFVWNFGNKTIRKFEEKQGLRKHILSCGDLSKDFGAVIILEDDLIVSPSFYLYTFKALNYYVEEDSVCGIGLYSHSWNGYAELPFSPFKNESDVFFGQFSITWGQCWSERQWLKFRNWYLKNENCLNPKNDNFPPNINFWGNQSWGKYFVTYIVENNLFYVLPYVSMTTNYSEPGEHNKNIDSSHQVQILNGLKTNYNFCKFESGIKYDSFFERIFPKDMLINGISVNDICVNINGTKSKAFGCKYILSTDKKGGKIISSYGALLRPIEANIVENVEGNAIFLKQLDNDKINKNFKKQNKEIRNYYFFHFIWSSLIFEGIRRFFVALKNKIFRR